MIKDLKSLIGYTEGGIVSKEIIRSEKVDITLFCMATGTEISDHTSTREGYLYVIEGDGKFDLEGEDVDLKSGRFIVIKKNAIHSVRAERNLSFLLLLIN